MFGYATISKTLILAGLIYSTSPVAGAAGGVKKGGKKSATSTTTAVVPVPTGAPVDIPSVPIFPGIDNGVLVAAGLNLSVTPACLSQLLGSVLPVITSCGLTSFLTLVQASNTTALVDPAFLEPFCSTACSGAITGLDAGAVPACAGQNLFSGQAAAASASFPLTTPVPAVDVGSAFFGLKGLSALACTKTDDGAAFCLAYQVGQLAGGQLPANMSAAVALAASPELACTSCAQKEVSALLTLAASYPGASTNSSSSVPTAALAAAKGAMDKCTAVVPSLAGSPASGQATVATTSAVVGLGAALLVTLFA